MAETPFSIISGFPSAQHVEDVCKKGQGENACRYLRKKGDGFACNKASRLKETIDQNVEKGKSLKKGDNCPGPVSHLFENQTVILGSMVRFQDHPYRDKFDGTLEGINLGNGFLSLEVLWEGETLFSPYYPIEYVKVNLTPASIKLSRPYSKKFGQTTIFFK